MKQLLILLIAASFLTGSCNAQQNKPKAVKLTAECMFDNQNRAITDSIINKVAFVKKEGRYFILTINNKKYLPCNLPSGYEGKKISISAYILQEFETEKIIAIPIKIFKASVSSSN